MPLSAPAGQRKVLQYLTASSQNLCAGVVVVHLGPGFRGDDFDEHDCAVSARRCRRRQGGSLDERSTGEVTLLCANQSFQVTVGKTSVVQVSSTVFPAELLLYATPILLNIRLPTAPLRWLSPSGHTVY